MRMISPPPDPEVKWVRDLVCPVCHARLMVDNLDIITWWAPVDGYGTSDKELVKGVRCCNCKRKFTFQLD